MLWIFTEFWTEVFTEEENPFADSRKDRKLFTDFNFSLVKHLMATPSFTTIWGGCIAESWTELCKVLGVKISLVWLRIHSGLQQITTEFTFLWTVPRFQTLQTLFLIFSWVQQQWDKSLVFNSGVWLMRTSFESQIQSSTIYTVRSWVYKVQDPSPSFAVTCQVHSQSPWVIYNNKLIRYVWIVYTTTYLNKLYEK